MPRGGRGHDDAVERLDSPEALERVDRRAASLDTRVHRDARTPSSQLDGFENRHRPGELALVNWCLEAELERDDEEVRGYEHRVLGMGDPEGRVEHRLVELTVGEGDEQARLPWPSAFRFSGRPQSHVRSSSRSALCATTRMSIPGSSRIIRDTSDPRVISTQRRSSGVPTKM